MTTLESHMGCGWLNIICERIMRVKDGDRIRGAVSTRGAGGQGPFKTIGNHDEADGDLGKRIPSADK